MSSDLAFRARFALETRPPMVVDSGGGGGYGLSGHNDVLIGLGPFREYIYFQVPPPDASLP
jgi:hypothetical protein